MALPQEDVVARGACGATKRSGGRCRRPLAGGRCPHHDTAGSNAGPVVQAAVAPPGDPFSNDQVEQAVALGREFIASLGPRPLTGTCAVAAWNVELATGLPTIDGHYQNDDGDLVPHSWNQTPDGTIVDVTAGQFDGPAEPAVIPAGDKRHLRYQPQT